MSRLKLFYNLPYSNNIQILVFQQPRNYSGDNNIYNSWNMRSLFTKEKPKNSTKK